jgi:hypothetical protein
VVTAVQIDRPCANPGSLEELFRCCVVEVDNLGSGFLIDKRTAITCSHLFIQNGVWNQPQEQTIVRWNGMEGRAKVTCIRTAQNRNLPDIAFLDDIEWDRGDLVPPFAMLSNDWDTGSFYYVWGHPEGDFEAGSALTFTYNRTDAVHRLGPTYKKLFGPFYPAPGFSGSPILNTKSGKVCGLAAISLNVDAAEGIAAVPISCVFDHRPGIKEALEKLYKTSTQWFDLTPSGLVWRSASECLALSKAAILQCYRNVGNEHYQPREIERDLQEFLASSASGMFIVGNSGMGKTTLLARFAIQQEKTRNIIALIESGRLPRELEALETELASRLGRTDSSPDVDSFWYLINQGAEWSQGLVILCIDAVNEYNQGGLDPRPIQLLDELDKLIGKFHSLYPRFKVVVTCRPETWRRAIETSPTRFRTRLETYFRPGPEIAWMLPRFSEKEFQGAYDRYSFTGKFRTPFDDLSPVAKYHLRDPFLLTLAESAYRDQEVPREIDTGALFESYFNELRSYEGVIRGLVGAMFLGEGTSDAVKRTAVTQELLRVHDPALYKDLDFGYRLSPGSDLLERNVIRRWESTDEIGRRVVQIRFTYDRFAEYLLSARFLEMIHDRAQRGGSMPAVAQAVVSANLTPSQRMAVVYGALQRALVSLRTKPDYTAILRAVAAIDARGQWLVISVLARTARDAKDGIEVLQDLLNQLGKRERKLKKTFPVMDSVYRVLQDEDYRLWLAEQAAEVQGRHLNRLYQYFVNGFQSTDPLVSAVAVQFLFFMWRSAQDRRYQDAQQITALLVAQVRSLIRMFLSSKGRALFRNLTAAFILILPEAPEDRFKKAIEFAHTSVRSLNVGALGTIAAFLVNTILVNFLLSVLRQLENPFQLASLDDYYSNRDRLFPCAKKILLLLGAQQDPSIPSVAEFRELAQCDNGIFIELLTFTLSTAYERAQSPEERSQILAFIDHAFFDEPRSPLAEYAASLSIYHINCFGRKSTEASMELMGRIATDILSKRKGRLLISDKEHNFNIIGTFGRAQHMHPVTTSELAADHGEMKFAFSALEQAVAPPDSEYYMYICENLGLLGTLVEPRYLFDVFSKILRDVGALGVMPEARALLPFSTETIVGARNKILDSLANIRVLYRQQVDKYLLETLESPELYSEIANERAPSFRLSFFFSWSFEQLTFRCLVYHYDVIGKQMLDSFWEAVHRKSSAQAARAVLAHLFKYVSELLK